ncbi:MAG: type II toxin-antitoxin system RelE/ParE family toxin [Niveispirillum sp.]|nr:type II toxin-antitoxin system RelE/ParE family toxin [Niveispirillum sp.]
MPNALNDLKAIARHIAAENPAAALKVASSIREAGNAMGQRSLGRPGRVAGTLEKLVAGLPYIICYTLSANPGGGEQIVILRVIHTARDWRKDKWPPA